MFADAGYTYSSNFFNASLFKHLINTILTVKSLTQQKRTLSPRRVQANVPLYVDTGTDNFSIDTAQLKTETNQLKKLE